MTKMQSKARTQFGKYIASLSLDDLAQQATQQRILSALARIKEADQAAAAALAAQKEMFPGHDMRAWKENLIQPSLMRV